jgi:CrcB protein
MLIYALIALGGAIGSVARHWISEAIGVRFDSISPAIPWGTLIVNITGCIVMGFFSVYSPVGWRHFQSNEARFFLLTGVCGGYTTFSAFSVQTLTLLRAGDAARAAAYVVSSVVICVLGSWLGYLLGMRLSAGT